MKDSIRQKLQTIAERHEEVAHLLSDPETHADAQKYTALSKEFAALEPIVKSFQSFQEAEHDLAAASELLTAMDSPEDKAYAQMEIDEAKQTIADEEAALSVHLLPRDPHDTANVFLEIRAGTGGDEASIFAGDLFRMYSKYADIMDWQVEVVSTSEGEHGGYKEIIAIISGGEVYSKLKFESGAHRVQRVPVTESQGRIHTSACTVAVLPEADTVEEIDINPADLRIDTFRASGAGGQHVNKTDSAIRITHLPSGVVVECQDERSQHKNRARAMSLLQAKLLSQAQDAQAAEQAQTRRNLVGSGDRSERIRTYNYPQGRVTDHRINLTLYQLDEVMEGRLAGVIDPLVREHQADLLAAEQMNV